LAFCAIRLLGRPGSESEPNQGPGVTFSFRLPAALAAAWANPSPRRSAARPSARCAGVGPGHLTRRRAGASSRRSGAWRGFRWSWT